MSVAMPGPPAPHMPGSAHGAEQVWDGAVPAPAGMVQGLLRTPLGRAGTRQGHTLVIFCVLQCRQDGQDGAGWWSSGLSQHPSQELALQREVQSLPSSYPGLGAPQRVGARLCAPGCRQRLLKAADTLVGTAATAARFPSLQVLRSLNKTYKNMKRKPVTVDLDPKAVTCNELFGVIHPSTREWKDGETPTLVAT